MYEGFSPASGAPESPAPERSINYEYGVRYFNEQVGIDLVGFFSDYDICLVAVERAMLDVKLAASLVVVRWR